MSGRSGIKLRLVFARKNSTSAASHGSISSCVLLGFGCVGIVVRHSPEAPTKLQEQPSQRRELGSCHFSATSTEGLVVRIRGESFARGCSLSYLERGRRVYYRAIQRV